MGNRSKAVPGIPDQDTAKALEAAGVKVGDTIETDDGQLIEIADTGPVPDLQEVHDRFCRIEAAIRRLAHNGPTKLAKEVEAILSADSKDLFFLRRPNGES